MLARLLCSWLWLGPPAQASASPEASAPLDERERVVLMVPERPGNADERVLATLDAHLHELEVAVISERHAGSLDLRELVSASLDPLARHDARGVMWIDIGEGDPPALAIYVVPRDSTQIYGRVITRPAEGEAALMLETLANVAAMAAIALGEGRAIRLEPELEPEPPPEPPPPDPPPPEPPEGVVSLDAGHLALVERAWLRLRAGYRGSSQAAQLPWQSSVTLALGLRPHARAHLELVADIVIPSTIPSGPIDLRLHAFPFGLAGGYAWSLARGWDVELAGRVALEPTRRSITTRSEGAPLAAPRTLWFASAEASVAFGLRVSPALRLAAGLGLVVVLVRRDIVVSSAEGNASTRFAPHPLRGLVTFGGEFDLVFR